jgi:hypothetical protein
MFLIKKHFARLKSEKLLTAGSLSARKNAGLNME